MQREGNNAVVGGSGLANLLDDLREQITVPQVVRDSQARLVKKMMVAWEKLLDAQMDGRPDIATIMKISEQIVSFSGWSVGERSQLLSLMSEIIDRGLTYRERMETIRHGGMPDTKKVSISISKAALSELEGL